MNVLRNTIILFGRSMRHIQRSPDTIITVAITPIVIMLLFVYVYGGAIKTSIGTDNYVNYLLPGILLISIASGVAYTAYRIFLDMQKGILARFHSMPVSRSSVLWGHVLTSLVSNAITVAVIILVALVMGFRSSGNVWAWLAAAGILALFTLALTWLAVIPGLTATSIEGASAFSYPLIFLPFTPPPCQAWFASLRKTNPSPPSSIRFARFSTVSPSALASGPHSPGAWG
jgi:ABC-2 type transport system permease protein